MYPPRRNNEDQSREETSLDQKKFIASYRNSHE